MAQRLMLKASTYFREQLQDARSITFFTLKGSNPAIPVQLRIPASTVQAFEDENAACSSGKCSSLTLLGLHLPKSTCTEDATPSQASFRQALDLDPAWSAAPVPLQHGRGGFVNHFRRKGQVDLLPRHVLLFAEAGYGVMPVSRARFATFFGYNGELSIKR
jgi:hypothetical protein